MLACSSNSSSMDRAPRPSPPLLVGMYCAAPTSAAWFTVAFCLLSFFVPRLIPALPTRTDPALTQVTEQPPRAAARLSIDGKEPHQRGNAPRQGYLRFDMPLRQTPRHRPHPSPQRHPRHLDLPFKIPPFLVMIFASLSQHQTTRRPRPPLRQDEDPRQTRPRGGRSRTPKDYADPACSTTRSSFPTLNSKSRRPTADFVGFLVCFAASP